MRLVFNRELLQSELGDAAVHEVMTEEEASSRTRSHLKHLEVLLRMSDVVDAGHPVAPNEPNHLVATRHHPVISCDAPDPKYISGHVFSAHLGMNFSPASRDELAINFVFRGEHGAALVQYGLRQGSAMIFAVSGNRTHPHDYYDAEEGLRQFVMRPFMVGFRQAVVRDIPIRMPEDGDVTPHGTKPTENLNTFRDTVSAWYRTFIPLRDSSQQWEDPSCANFGRLTWTKWWEDKLF